MNRCLLLLLLWVSVTKPVMGQIPTPDFRYYSSCPDVSEVYKCTGWFQPTLGTSDYFNVCAPSITVGVPQNWAGYQVATNNAYTGLYTYTTGAVPDYKEYISTDFAPLTIGQTYTMTILVSLADSSTHGTDGLGILFSTYPIRYLDYTPLPMAPQIDYSSFGIIKDKINWVQLSKSFVADSAYTHLTLGCFKSNNILQKESISAETKKINFSYYYIGQIGEPDSNRHQPTDFLTPPSADSAKIIVLSTAPKCAFPSAFSPNGDALNDVFRIVANRDAIFNDYGLHIFNRWGQRVFISRDPNKGWDGTVNNTPQDIGTYFYFAEFTINGKLERIKGDVTLIR